MDMINAAVLGVGRIGRLHSETMHKHLPYVNLAAVYDPQIDLAWCEQLGVAHHDLNSILRNDSISAVLICTPSPSHVQLIQLAAEHGKHIFCEKPLALSVDEIKQAIAVTEQHGVKLQVGFNRRFDPHFFELRQRLDAGDIGKPFMYRITSRDPELPSMDYLRDSGGIFLDMTIHDFDMLRYLSRAEVTEVYASGGVFIDDALHELGDVDAVQISLKLSDGSLATIDNCRQSGYGYDQRIEVLGTKGSVQAENALCHQVTLFQADATRSANPEHFFLERYKESYIQQMQDFFCMLRSKQTPEVSGLDGLAPLLIGQCALQSLQENAPVAVPTVETELALVA